MPRPSYLHQPRATAHPLLGPPQEAILRALLTYFYLTASQVCRLLYAAGSLTYVQSMLKHLTMAGYCLRLYLPRPSQYGSSPSVYTLARRGLNHLRAQGLAVPARYHPSEQREHSYLFLRHTLAVNDTLIAIQLLARRYPQISVTTMLHERTLKRQPLYVNDSVGQRLAVVMDGWLDLRLHETQRMCLGLEVDLGTEEQSRWRRKVRGLVACSHGPYQERFAATSLTLGVLAIPGQSRLAQLLHWTELELAHLPDKEAVADLFRFTSLPPAMTTPEQLFCSPCWYRPFRPVPVPLLNPLSLAHP